MRADRASDNAAGRCQARRPGRLLEAMCKHGPRGMAVTYRSRKRTVPYRTRLTGRLISSTRGSMLTASGPSPFGGSLSDDLLQHTHQRLRRRDVRRVARIELESAPAILGLGALRELPENVARRNARAIDVAARHRRLAMFELQLRLEAFDRHVDPAGVEPVEIGLRRVRRRRVRRDAVAVARACCLAHRLAPALVEIKQRLT